MPGPRFFVDPQQRSNNNRHYQIQRQNPQRHEQANLVTGDHRRLIGRDEWYEQISEVKTDKLIKQQAEDVYQYHGAKRI